MTKRTPQPFTTPAPEPSLVFMPGMSPASVEPPAQTLVPGPTPSQSILRIPSSAERDERKSRPSFPLPKLRFEIRDLTHAGATRFLQACNASEVFSDAVRNVLRLLYVSPAQPDTLAPPTRSVTLILRDMDGVAYATGSDLDSDHKEIHFSLGYIAGIARESSSTAHGDQRGSHEIIGVLTHELVHCYQWTGKGHCPGGLIEGVADWVRLSCDLSPPHWKKEVSGTWDRGYQHTAFFLDYLETRFGSGTVRKINEKLRTQKYEEKPFWTELLGRPVEQLWTDYVATSEGDLQPSATI